MCIRDSPYYGLARGFLTGKYRPGITVESARAAGAADYQNDRGWAVLAKLDEIAKELDASLSAVALGWLRGHGSLPIASARTIEQAKEVFPIVDLNANQLAALDTASAL